MKFLTKQVLNQIHFFREVNLNGYITTNQKLNRRLITVIFYLGQLRHISFTDSQTLVHMSQTQLMHQEPYYLIV